MKKPSNCIACGKTNRQANHLFCSLDCQKSDKRRVICPLSTGKALKKKV